MDEAGVPDVLQSERMGHEVPGMRGVYAHLSDQMRADLKTALQERWEASLRERAQLVPRSIVPALCPACRSVSASEQDRLPFRSQNRTFDGPTRRSRSPKVGC